MRKAIKMDYDKFNDLFDYTPETGIIRNKADRGKRAKKGAEAGGVDKVHGYRQICVDGANHKAHRIAWLLHHGSIDEYLEVDHIHGNKMDNRISQLRLITHQENLFNAKKRKNGLPMGVSRAGKKFRADIMADGERFYLGAFHSPELAGFAYTQAKEIHHVIPSRAV